MQAPLSNTASGKYFNNGTFTAVLPCFSAEVDSQHSHSQADPGIHPVGVKATPSIADGLGLAHDAGNLLGALGLYCQLLAAPGVLREEHRHYAEELQLLSGRSRTLIDRLLSPEMTGRHAGGNLPDPQQQVVVPEVIEHCRGLLERIARRAIEVAYEAGAAPPVPMSRHSLERILVNLTKNAAEASGGAGPSVAITLRVSCERSNGPASEADRIVLSVEDKGCGMSSAAVKVLLGKGVAQAGNHGIGFRVVRELVGASGGRLRLFSKSGSGTTVEISWAVPAVIEAGLTMQEQASEQLRLLSGDGLISGSAPC